MSTRETLIATTVERAKSEIVYDVAAGIVPRSVSSFSELHDYVDANEYGGAVRWPEDGPPEGDDESYVTEHCKFWNAVQDQLHEWLASGVMRQAADRVAS